MSDSTVKTNGRLKSARDLACDKRGSTLVYTALIAAVIFGIIGLAIDASRAMVVRSEAQAAADAAALVAASQLDRTPTSIARADAALANLIENDQRFGSGGVSAVAIASVRYLTDLPDDDGVAVPDDLVTTDPLQARFVEVVTAPIEHVNTFLRAVGAVDPLNVARRAVAGCNQVVCRAPPLMICNPAEANGNTGASFNIDTWRGRQIRFLHQGGANASWAPGNFGYLSVSGNGANALRDSLASVNGSNLCYGLTVETEPGVKNGARNALNVRFGIYQNPGFGGGASNSADFAPDINVRTMPRDLSFTGPANRFGNGSWNCLAYWNANHASSGLTRPAGCTAATSGYTRYAMYQWENANNRRLNPPQNFANRLVDRRIIYVAVVNCVDEGVAGRVDVPPLTYLRVFLTEPVSEPSGVEIIGEVLDVVQLGTDDAVLIDNVQLYR
ncbi:MAG: hypothetical protein K2X34_07435 [Hyphomonadaceae bacterium]|nr:hypothetical protein [Hyphomonadaceae bacterium]